MATPTPKRNKNKARPADRMGGVKTTGGNHGRSITEHLPRQPVNPWDLQSGETPRAFAGFRLYLEMGPDRSIQAAYRKSRGYPIDADRHADGTFLNWSRKHSWIKRALAYDAQNAADYDAALKKAREKEAEKWSKRQDTIREHEYSMAERLRKVAGKMLDTPLIEKLIEGGPDGEITKLVPANWKMGDAAKFLEVFSKLARMAAQMATNTERRELTGEDGGPIQTERTVILDGLEDDELEQLERLIRKVADPGGTSGGEGTPPAETRE